ncbi:hypothetical protein TNIN_370881 [Trichonephila inaurata madagascariensis]|uniref:Uncharacterized protein n=1 Tax=Trichonephila inaurata madagascariensis TaxID=2747483 RepID=A0A8X6KJN2_9ARAC|nr:hypothetical protein TNIN_370881 [Trichonephila inaurata madagascariensis]
MLQNNKKCYPNHEALRATSICADARPKDILNYTCSSLCQYLDEGYNTEANFKTISKWNSVTVPSRISTNRSLKTQLTRLRMFFKALLFCFLKRVVLWKNPQGPTPLHIIE